MPATPPNDVTPSPLTPGPSPARGEGRTAACIVLVGYRGTGKSTVGRLLAGRLGWAFLDADTELEARAGRTVSDIFRADGEPAFRDLESAVLADLVGRERCVIATGGGAVLRPANRERLRAAGFVAWLTLGVDAIVARLEGDPTTAARRPPLTVGGRREVEELLAVREPLYREVADAAFDAGASPDAVADAILRGWAEFVGRVKALRRPDGGTG